VLDRNATVDPSALLRGASSRVNPSSSITLTCPSANPSAHIRPHGDALIVRTLCGAARAPTFPCRLALGSTNSGDTTATNLARRSTPPAPSSRALDRANTYADPVFAPKITSARVASTHVNRTRLELTARKSALDATQRHRGAIAPASSPERVDATLASSARARSIAAASSSGIAPPRARLCRAPIAARRVRRTSRRHARARVSRRAATRIARDSRDAARARRCRRASRRGTSCFSKM